ncbi:hypothetical protein FEK30_12545 [Picosynechococcus sp. PCC 11901]|uniref:hypothetical protein n=1 Tax=Picosynechococcus sp. PCC 11901 TaxID=2579791 RepID=UPI0010FBCD51|nr:hypothetical protein [Picosynechococcus sp. PCC 11901]QCS50187.1 hypothetical protein FEK30_12545 [Picosynechococcus sp. PCC 11901]
MRGRGGMRPGAGRKSAWQSGATKTIRVPAAIEEELLTLGKHLDRGQAVLTGQTLKQLEDILVNYQAQCDTNPGEAWEPVRQLIAEIRTVLDRAPHRGRGGMGHRGMTGQGNRCRAGQPLEMGGVDLAAVNVEAQAPKFHC